MSEDPATPEQTAELRGQGLVWQMLLHQASAQLNNLAAYPHGSLRRAVLEVASEHVQAAERLMLALDDVLDPELTQAGRLLSIHHLRCRVERERRAIGQAE